MSESKFFIIKHDLASLEALPNYIWRTGKSEAEVPKKFNEIKAGARWVAFAYRKSDEDKQPLSQITGFFECTEEAHYGDIPPEGKTVAHGEVKAWLIKGKPYGDQPQGPVSVRSIDQLLGRKHFKGQAIVPISDKEFEQIRKETLSRGVREK
jgi:hypothetical protein